ncbi:MAG: hypothetical protein ACXU82_03585 [Caulobacteraceae bacterium]
MPMYVTMYSLPNGLPTATQCYAKDRGHLRELMTLRRMGETEGDGFYVLPRPKMASELVRMRQLRAANHALVWISMVACRAAPERSWELLNDQGLVHELAHTMHSVEMGRDIEDFGLARFADKVEDFERTVPGAHPCWGVADKPVDLQERVRVSPFGVFFQDLEKSYQARFQEAVMAAYGGDLRSLEQPAPAPVFSRTAAKPKRFADPRARGFDRQSIAQGAAARQAMRAKALANWKPPAKAKPNLGMGYVELKGAKYPILSMDLVPAKTLREETAIERALRQASFRTTIMHQSGDRVMTVEAAYGDFRAEERLFPEDLAGTRDAERAVLAAIGRANDRVARSVTTTTVVSAGDGKAGSPVSELAALFNRDILMAFGLRDTMLLPIVPRFPVRLT